MLAPPELDQNLPLILMIGKMPRPVQWNPINGSCWE